MSAEYILCFRQSQKSSQTSGFEPIFNFVVPFRHCSCVTQFKDRGSQSTKLNPFREAGSSLLPGADFANE